MTEREISVQNRKGIFTVNQLSYTFRYRKPSKQAKRPPKPHQFSLQALALRTQKVHIHGTPNLPVADTSIYYDIEGLSHPDFYYLIGILVVHQNNINYSSFWAASERDQAAIFQQFAEAVTNIPDIRLFHFGSYDTAAIKHARRICEPRYTVILDSILRASTNVLTFINSQVYFPTYSNSLKEIASYLGFKWSDPNASGIQSIIWREQWRLNGDPALKNKLIEYNQEDCRALRTICDFIRSTMNSENQTVSATCEGSTIVYTKELAKPFKKWGRAVFALKDLEFASKYAYFDYQRERVFIRTSRVIAKVEKINKKKAHPLPVNKRIVISCKRCIYCNSRNIRASQNISRRVVDLRFSPSGIKRWIVQYLASRYQCRRCGKTFLPEGWASCRRWYGINLAKWCVYLNFECKQSMWNVRDSLRDVFGILIDRRMLYHFKSLVISSYMGFYEQLRRHILSSPLLHIDETDVAIRITKGYVWVFATLDVVWYLYKGSRSGDFLKDMLSGFSGELISDFYSIYDSINCPQQKCLLHLLRGFNDDLKNNPFDKEFKTIAGEFGKVLRRIIDSVDRYGLKKRHLHKHKREAESFVDHVRNTSFSSDLALRNNNNAEHAIKNFVKYKRTSEGLYSERSLNEALVMLSALETCRYNRVSFLKFLLSGKTDLEAMMMRQNRSP